MGKYLEKAEDCLGKIRHYYDQGHATGHFMSLPHCSKLQGLYVKASRDKGDTGDADAIRKLIKQADRLMNEMKQREKRAGSNGSPMAS